MIVRDKEPESLQARPFSRRSASPPAADTVRLNRGVQPVDLS